MSNSEIYKCAFELSKEIEKTLHQKFNKGSDRIALKYKQKLRMLIPNLKSNKNTEARIKVVSEKWSPHKLCFVKEDDFIPTKEKQARDKARKKYLKKHIVTMSVVEEYQSMIKREVQRTGIGSVANSVSSINASSRKSQEVSAGFDPKPVYYGRRAVKWD